MNKHFSKILRIILGVAFILVVLVLLYVVLYFSTSERGGPQLLTEPPIWEIVGRCSEVTCENNISHLCCDCEVDGPQYFVETNSREFVAQCGEPDVSTDHELCTSLWRDCFFENS